MKKRIITFQDHGQDFLKWTITPTNRIEDCQPFQGSIWCNKYITNDELFVGGFVTILTTDHPSGILTIKYPIESIETVD